MIKTVFFFNFPNSKLYFHSGCVPRTCLLTLRYFYAPKETVPSPARRITGLLLFNVFPGSETRSLGPVAWLLPKSVRLRRRAVHTCLAGASVLPIGGSLLGLSFQRFGSFRAELLLF